MFTLQKIQSPSTYDRSQIKMDIQWYFTNFHGGENGFLEKKKIEIKNIS
jgi:hypothetical protein